MPRAHRPSLLALALVLCACRAGPDAPAARPRPARAAPAPGRLEVAGLFDLDARLKLRTQVVGWTPDGSAWLTLDGGRVTAVDVASGARRTFLDPAALERACARLRGIDAATARAWGARTDLVWSADLRRVLWSDAGDLFAYELASGEAARLTDDARAEEVPSFSPDGERVAFVAEGDLYVCPSDGSAPARALTTDGDEDHLRGKLDWVYQEEVYGRGNWRGFWWSPDSARVAFLALDQTEVPEYVVTDHRGIEPTFERWRYPKPGDPNPRVALLVADVADGTTRAVDLGRWAAHEPLVVRVDWKPDGSQLLFQVQDRLQTWLDLVEADPASGAARVLFRETTSAWVEPLGPPEWIDGERFLWRSERDGWAHLYLYGADGALQGRVTSGPWEVDAFDHWDAAGRRAWFVCDKDDEKGAQLYRVALDGSALERVTRGEGTHDVSFAPDGEHFLDTYRSLARWPVLSLCRADGEPLREVERVDGAPAAAAGVVPPELVHPVTRDGVALNAHLFAPQGLAPGEKAPVLCFVYSGPHAPKVKDLPLAFDGLYHAMLAQRGFLVWVCDNRSASGKGLASARIAYRDLGRSELADLEDGLDWLVAQGVADPARVGIWGWSYGGYQTAYALTHSRRFALGIAGAPVTDWRLYDSIYTERLMGAPAENAAGYDRSSVLLAAGQLSGRLLLLHGVIDENVHMQNTLNLADALQHAGIPFEMMLFPGNRHSIVDPAQKRFLYETMARFVEDNL